MKLIAKIRYNLAVLRWILRSPSISDFIIGDKYLRDAYRPAMNRWLKLGPKREDYL